jgi:glycolate oxidase
MTESSGLTPELRQRLIREFTAIVGAEGVVSAPDELRVYDCDAMTYYHRALPGLVVLPRDTAEVAAVVRCCSQAAVPFIARGAGTGLSGGATPRGGEVLIVLTRMTRILSLDVGNRLATVEAGCVNLWLTRAALQHGFFYAPDPASQQACTLGGNVAENAGGPHCLKYGATTNHVIGLTAVLADGRVVRLGGPLRDAPGYDLAGVFVGSEGTLGICTEITLRLMPVPEAVKTILAVFKSIEDASGAVSGIIARGIIPVALEMIDRETTRVVEAYAKAGYPLDAEAVLLIELEGLRAEIEVEAVGVEAVCRAHRCLDVKVARTEEERALLWKGRKAAAGAFGKLTPQYYHQDAVVPRTQLPRILREIEEIAGRHGVWIANVFHAGDGNIHPLVCYDGRNPGEKDRAFAAGAEIMRRCIELGGTVSGEHGIGLEKREYLPLMYAPADLAAMLKVKGVFDPRGLCNPGKIFPEECYGKRKT